MGRGWTTFLLVHLASFCRGFDLEADYVVVGAGSAGSVAAGRLAAAGFHVLVLEAGTYTQEQLSGCTVPGNCPYMTGPDGRNLTVFDVPMEWLTILENENYAREYEWTIVSNRTGCLPSQARGVGGCGIHNAMIYIRGTPRDFANDGPWGVMGWTWDQVLDAYKRSENNTAFGGGADISHSKMGPVQISSVAPEARSTISDMFLDACSKVQQCCGKQQESEL